MDHQAFAQMLGNYGEFLGSIAVLGTLIYLAVQIRHSKELLERSQIISLSQVQQARANSGREQWLVLSDSTYLAPLVAADSGMDEMTVRLRAYLGASLVHADNMVYQYELGLVDELSMARTTDMIQRNYDRWVELELNPPPRVRNWHQQHSQG
jgi:hypothetical protein